MATSKVIVTMERYHELLRKEFVYDLKRQEKMASSYTTADEKRLFQIPEEKEVE